MDNLSPQIEKQLLYVVHEFLNDLKAERAQRAISINASIENDLGIGSLERAELFRRIEVTFSIQLSTDLLINANTLNDLLIAIQGAKPAQEWTSQMLPLPPLELLDLLPVSATTLVDVLLHYAEKRPDRPHIYLQDDDGNEQIITYGKLLNQATMLANGLLAHGLKAGETVAIMLPTSEEFFYTFFAIYLAGGIPVPIYPPFRLDRIEEYAKREAIILNNAEIRFLITFSKGETLSKVLQAFIPSLKAVLTADNLNTTKMELPNIAHEANDAGLIQYTSGSTGDPKGVLLSHANLLANIRAAGKAINVRATDVVVSWLPLYHDMGLIGCWFCPLYFGVPVTILSPLTFLSRPERWLWAIHYHRGTLSAGPNFAYELCIRKINEKKLEGLDLSCWRLAFNGAEAISPRTIKNFTKKFEPYGFKAETLFPVYGLAESAVALAFPTPGKAPKIDRVERVTLEKDKKAIPTTSNMSEEYLEFVCCGKSIPGHEIRIVDEADHELGDRIVGLLQFRGPSATKGYYHNPIATKAIYHGDWIDSGDYAYKANEEIYIVGRKKDLIIKAGRNIYPEAIEEIVNSIEGIRKGCVIAFGVNDQSTGTEKLIVVAETRDLKAIHDQAFMNEVTERINVGIGLPPDQVIFVVHGIIPKTSSGKLQRSACKKAYLDGKLTRHRMPAWMQMTKLFLASTIKKALQGVKNSARFIYAIYLSVILVVIVPLLLITLPLPPKIMKSSCRFLVRLFFYCAACPINVSGIKNLYKAKPMILVSNHASYIDVLVLLAILPIDFVFNGKAELLKVPVLRVFLKKIGYIGVDRLDIMQSIADMQHIKDTLIQGYSVVIFPEGTFTYATGLRPFKYGAFKLAVETNTPICPIVLQGTRTILRDESKMMRRGAVKVTICEPNFPVANDWHEIVRLSTEARLEIAKYCGEQIIDLVVAGLER